MRLAFWRADKKVRADEASVPPRTNEPASVEPVSSGDLDIRLVGRALARKRGFILLPTLLALALAVTAVNMITPRYKSEARILIDGRENEFLRTRSERLEERTALDAEAVTSQVQLVLSRDLARDIIKQNKLGELPEFDPVLRGVSPLKSIAAMIGLVKDPLAMTPDERVMDAYYERLTVYAVDKSRVLVVEFQSQDPTLAAQVANSIADGYLVVQQNARQAQAKSASQWLAGEIQGLRKKVEDAEARVEAFRAKGNSFTGTNNTSLSNQQMGETNTQLNNARTRKSDAEAKARLIREMLQGGQPIEASEVLNSETMRVLQDRRVALRAQLAEQSSTLLDAHPRIKELKAQIAEVDRNIRDEAGKISRSLDNDARLAGAQVDSLNASLEQAKKQASSTNDQDVKLRALEREAKSQRDLLEAYLAKYREADTRVSLDTPAAEGRIISRAVVSNTPAYPKKLPIVLIATLATLMLTSGVVITGELLRLTAPRASSPAPAMGNMADVMVLAARVEPMIATRTVAAPLAVSPPPTPTAVELARPSPIPSPAPAEMPAPEPAGATPRPSSELELLTSELLAAGGSARKITVLGTAGSQAVTATALSIARMLAVRARVVLVDLAGSPQMLAGLSVDPAAPGLIELMLGEASFASIITKDQASRLHIVNAGRPGADRNQLQSPRLALAIDALLRVYDHVLLDAGNASDLPAELLTAGARAVVVPDPNMSAEARSQMTEQLREVGFGAVTMLRAPALDANHSQPGRRGVAA
ncbi:GumC family protein [Bradyrhizobium aeschynomenes]|uniref:GumC family protein n=1 Tax=Bradyrhizobium aeschynomenes TaxID=2734909 RepID=UPI0015520E49|nr:exopolysaccharide transport family protein [Bradyrhizobium aeschynomenes]NPV22504.1 lipopolysaccharide biosynthesis protein [Bradyrhizobium aeschynomenes]